MPGARSQQGPAPAGSSSSLWTPPQLGATKAGRVLAPTSRRWFAVARLARLLLPPLVLSLLLQHTVPTQAQANPGTPLPMESPQPAAPPLASQEQALSGPSALPPAQAQATPSAPPPAQAQANTQDQALSDFLQVFSCNTSPGVISNATICPSAMNYTFSCVPGSVTVACASGAGVTNISLAGVQAQSDLPSTLSALSSLAALYLGNSATLTGSLDALSGLTSLQGLSFDGANWQAATEYKEFPSVVGTLASLRWLQLPYNRLTVPFPTFWSGLSLLQSLGFNGSPFTGSIHSSIGRLSSLRQLDFWMCNSLTGTIPDALGDLASLEFLDMSGCSGINGTIPASLGGLKNLTYLGLSSMGLSGAVPGALSGMASLNALKLGGQGLNGTVPDSLSALPSLQTLVLSNNQLVGSVPGSLLAMQSLTYLDLSSNFLTGQAPQPNSSKLLNVELQGNYLYGLLADPFCYSDRYNASGNCLTTAACQGVMRSSSGCQEFCGLSLGQDRGQVQRGPCGGLGMCTPTGSVTQFFECRHCTNGTFPTPDGQSCTSVPDPPPGGPPPSPLPAWALALLATVGGLVALVGLAAIIQVMLRVRTGQLKAIHQHRREDAESAAGAVGHNEQRLWKFTSAELEAATDNFSDDRHLGKGGFGDVFLGVVPPGHPALAGRKVAVKRERADQGGTATTSFYREVEVLSRVRHRHVVELLGYCESHRVRYLVYEFVEQGTLTDLLKRDSHEGAGTPENAASTLDWETRLQLAEDAARGLLYLHEECKVEILHLDMKSANILVDAGFRALVADFGLSSFKNNEGRTKGRAAKHWRGKEDKQGGEEAKETFETANLRGTTGYIDPYFLFSKNTLNKSSDVYSFGIVLLEIVTGLPSRGIVFNNEQVLLLRYVLSRVRLEGFASIASPAIHPRLASPSTSYVSQNREMTPGRDGSPTRSPCTLLNRDHVQHGSIFLLRRFVCLGLWCCVFERSARPSMREVVQTLAEIRRGKEETGSEAVVLNSSYGLVQGLWRTDDYGSGPSFSCLDSIGLSS